MPGRDEEFQRKMKEREHIANLGKAKLLGEPQRPRTAHTTTFQGVEVEWDVVAMPDGKAAHYRLIITDNLESKRYLLPFGQDGKEIIIESLQALPNIGDQVIEMAEVKEFGGGEKVE